MIASATGHPPSTTLTRQLSNSDSSSVGGSPIRVPNQTTARNQAPNTGRNPPQPPARRNPPGLSKPLAPVKDTKTERLRRQRTMAITGNTQSSTSPTATSISPTSRSPTHPVSLTLTTSPTVPTTNTLSTPATSSTHHVHIGKASNAVTHYIHIGSSSAGHNTSAPQQTTVALDPSTMSNVYKISAGGFSPRGATPQYVTTMTSSILPISVVNPSVMYGPMQLTSISKGAMQGSVRIRESSSSAERRKLGQLKYSHSLDSSLMDEQLLHLSQTPSFQPVENRSPTEPVNKPPLPSQQDQQAQGNSPVKRQAVRPVRSGKNRSTSHSPSGNKGRRNASGSDSDMERKRPKRRGKLLRRKARVKRQAVRPVRSGKNRSTSHSPSGNKGRRNASGSDSDMERKRPKRRGKLLRRKARGKGMSDAPVQVDPASIPIEGAAVHLLPQQEKLSPR
uniref:Uncharacterized protein n=1 Tax=Branchiostoma floridae TaxID=7739 RepID=C3ZCV3_BRAFL|eukprot:XP_002593595.1 hypothetical protein BRAFLDRAFT_98714 [Branchiostoma floridae]